MIGSRSGTSRTVGAKHVAARHSGTVAMTIIAVALVLGAIRTVPCLNGGVDTRALWTTQCYSDIPLFYVGHGLHLDFGWFGGADPRFPAIEYPALLALFIETMAKLTHLVVRIVDGRPPDMAAAPATLARDTGFYLAVSSVVLIGVALVAAHLLGRLIPRSAWVVLAIVTAPLVVLEPLVNWDVLPVLAVIVALLAWRNARWGWFGVAVGAGIALKVYPVLMLGAAVALGLRRRQWRMVLIPIVSASAVWLAANAPSFLIHPDRWLVFWRLNSGRPADFGSLWVAARIGGLAVPTGAINLIYAVGMMLASLVVLIVALRVRREPTMAELSLVLLVAFLALNKVYSPQYSLWLLPFVAVSFSALPWVAVWAAAEVTYFATIWHHIVRVDIDQVQGPDKVYVGAIGLRVLVQCLLAGVVLVRYLRPGRDPALLEGPRKSVAE